MLSDHRSSYSFLIISLVIFLLLVQDVPVSFGQGNVDLSNCSVLNFTCGDRFTNISYPFWGNQRPHYCGLPGYKLDCVDDGVNTEIEILSEKYRVLGIDQLRNIMKIIRKDFLDEDDACPADGFDTITPDFNLFNYPPDNLTLYYGCPAFSGSNAFPNKFICQTNETSNTDAYYWSKTLAGGISPPNPSICLKSIEVPVMDPTLRRLAADPTNITILSSILREGFDVNYSDVADSVTGCYECVNNGGECRYSLASVPSFTCFCTSNVTKRTICSPTVPVLRAGFDVGYSDAGCHDCMKNGGECRYSSASVSCFCPSSVTNRTMCSVPGPRKPNVQRKIIIGVSAAVGASLLTIIFVFFFFRRWCRKHNLDTSSTLISRSLSPDLSLKPDPEKGSTYFHTPIFSYKELEEATNNFDDSKELGDGGFGTVYYGELRDGRVVAVKRLYENNCKRVEQFMNEVTILSLLRHQNLVTLYGCTSRHSRELLLVYEYVPNGTVADHLHGEQAKAGLVTWPIRMSIAIESAGALAYLHASDIIHRDVKTNNILLDNNFHVKVADFGLSRLFPTDVTHVSTAPQGTPGYVDPEYYQCYQLTDKSDVYSFGVVLIELISSMPAVDINRHRHEINLSNMAINKIHNHALHELVDSSLGFESDYCVRRMITLVAELAFRCLQQDRDMRPTMAEVVEVLKGIENEGSKVVKGVEVDNPADDVRLLKNIPPLSPDSVMEKLVSLSSTPNTSS
ncbi:Protein kinase domain [Macleaya cordata]|uniref:non-specific serine/threonine protein kinase n=1 Tax=Macleaya cordata TaxID=56857 RepID=A0A200Q3C2_MACCD|nr:Protein kinase domain [Macleaya cordata]